MPDISESITAVPGEGRTRLVTGRYQLNGTEYPGIQ